MSSGSSGSHNGESAVICEASVVLPQQTLSSQARAEEEAKMTSLSSAFAGRSLFGSSAPPPPSESPLKEAGTTPEKTPVKSDEPKTVPEALMSAATSAVTVVKNVVQQAAETVTQISTEKIQPRVEPKQSPAAERATEVQQQKETPSETPVVEQQGKEPEKPTEPEVNPETEVPSQAEAAGSTEEAAESADTKEAESKNNEIEDESGKKVVEENPKEEEEEEEKKEDHDERMEEEDMEDTQPDPAPTAQHSSQNMENEDETDETNMEGAAESEADPEQQEEAEADEQDADGELTMAVEAEEDAGPESEEAGSVPPPQKKRKLTRKELARKMAEGRRKKREQEKQGESSEGEEGAEKQDQSGTGRRSLRARNSTPAQAKSSPVPRSAKKEESSRRSSRVRVSAQPETPKTVETPPPAAARRGRGRRAEAPASAPPAQRPARNRQVTPDVTTREEPKKTKAQTVGPAEKKRGRKRGGTKKMDPYDLDSNIDASPEPLKHISMERSSFGELRFTTPQSTVRPRFSFTARAARKSQSGPSSSQESHPSGRRTSEKLTSSVSHDLKRQMSPKSSPSAGELGDVSSLEPQRSSSGSLARSSGSSRGGALFGDIEGRMEEGDEGEVLNGDSFHEGEVTKKSHKRNSRAGTSRTPAKTKATPEPKKGRQPSPIPELSAPEQLRIDFPPDSHSQLEPGARVMAKWLDKCHYPGVVIRNVGFGRYKIRFVTDGNVRDMPGPDLVLLSHLDVGKTLMVATEDANEDELLEPVQVVKTPNAEDANEWAEACFEVQNLARDENQRVTWTDFVIDKDQRSGFVDNVVNKAAQDVVSDNISEGRGQRRSRPSTFSPASTPATPQTETPKRKPKTPTSHTPPSSSTPNKRGRKPKTKEQPQPSPAPQESKKPRKIFKDFKFVLTSANRRAKPGESADNDDERPPVVFNKRQVRQAIEERGGTVIEDFAHTERADGVFLVADTHYRTHKYLSALARAVPCVSHMWILDSCAENTALDYAAYILPSGVSLSSRVLIEWHADAPTLLKGLRVMVHTENRNNPGSLDFVQIWAPLVRCMGAEVLETLPKEKNLDILLTDASCPDSLLAAAKEQGADTISSEWLIQAIITGERPAADAHEKFRYDYVEQVGGSES